MPSAQTTFANLHKLTLGSEVDYNCVDEYWVPARVEAVEADDGHILRLRFRVGVADVTHRVDLSAPADVVKVAAAGTLGGSKRGSAAFSAATLMSAAMAR